MTLLKFDNFSATPICVKSNFGQFKRSKNVIFGNFRDLELWNLVNLWLESCSNLLKSKFLTSKIAKNDIFGLFEFVKIDFSQNQRGGKIIYFQQSQALTSHFESFWSIVLNVVLTIFVGQNSFDCWSWRTIRYINGCVISDGITACWWNGSVSCSHSSVSTGFYVLRVQKTSCHYAPEAFKIWS